MNYEKLWNLLKNHYVVKMAKMEESGKRDKIGYAQAKSVSLVMWHLEEKEKKGDLK